jgi:uncharacterized protein YwgA
MPAIGTRDLLLLLVGGVGTKESAGLGGITRLQKLLFLLEKEEGLKPAGNGFRFEPYKAGPYSSKLYDDLEFLENLGLLESEVTAEATEPEAAEVEKEEFDIDRFDFNELVAGEPPKRSDPDAYEERRFRLTAKGKQRLQNLLSNSEFKPVADSVRKIKSKYSSYSLNDLLYYVYTKYPEMTVESEIKDQVLGRRPR